MKNIFSCILSLALLLAAVPVTAQQTTGGGTVKDPAGEPLPRASHKLPIRTKVLKREEAEGDAE